MYISWKLIHKPIRIECTISNYFAFQNCFSADDSICCQHSSSPLGNGAIVETSDGEIVLLQRSNNVGEFPGHFVFPGGHPEVYSL